MEQTPSPPESEVNSRPNRSSIWVCLVAGLVMTTALALAAAHSPPRIRLIGLFSIAFGLAVGWLLARLVEKLDVGLSRRALGAAAAVFTVCGLIGSTWETVRLNEAQKPKSGTDTVAARLIEQIRSQSNAGNHDETPGLTSPVETSSLVVFRRYLAHRLRPLGELSSPWPEIFWCVELCAAAAASVWMATRRRFS